MSEQERRYPLFFKELAEHLGIDENAPLLAFLRTIRQRLAQLDAAEKKLARRETALNELKDWAQKNRFLDYLSYVKINTVIDAGLSDE